MILRSIAPALLAGVLSLSAARAEGEGKGYFAWAEARGLVGVFASPDADFDGDGVTNLRSYAFGLDEGQDDPEAYRLPYRSDIGDPPEPAITFVIPANCPPDVTYIVEMRTPSGKRVEVARKNGAAQWFGRGRIIKKVLKDGSTEVSVMLPLNVEVPEGENPLHIRVEFTPGT